MLYKQLFSPSEKIYQHLYFKGFFKVNVNEKKSFQLYHAGHIEENQIFWKSLKGGWEKKSISLWEKLVENADCVLDIGANTGLYGLVAKCTNPKATVHCFEPLAGVYSILSKNITRNHYSIFPHQKALSNYNGKANVYLPKGNEFVYSVTVNENTLTTRSLDEVDEVEIETIRLDTFIEQNNISNIDLMKIDVETHEPEVIEGMGVYFKQFRPSLIIEVLDEKIAEKLNVLFEGMDYLYFNIDDKNNSLRKVDKFTPSDHWNFLVCKKEVALSLNLI